MYRSGESEWVQLRVRRVASIDPIAARGVVAAFTTFGSIASLGALASPVWALLGAGSLGTAAVLHLALGSPRSIEIYDRGLVLAQRTSRRAVAWDDVITLRRGDARRGIALRLITRDGEVPISSSEVRVLDLPVDLKPLFDRGLLIEE